VEDEVEEEATRRKQQAGYWELARVQAVRQRQVEACEVERKELAAQQRMEGLKVKADELSKQTNSRKAKAHAGAQAEARRIEFEAKERRKKQLAENHPTEEQQKRAQQGLRARNAHKGEHEETKSGGGGGDVRRRAGKGGGSVGGGGDKEGPWSSQALTTTTSTADGGGGGGAVATLTAEQELEAFLSMHQWVDGGLEGPSGTVAQVLLPLSSHQEIVPRGNGGDDGGARHRSDHDEENKEGGDTADVGYDDESVNHVDDGDGGGDGANGGRPQPGSPLLQLTTGVGEDGGYDGHRTGVNSIEGSGGGGHVRQRRQRAGSNSVTVSPISSPRASAPPTSSALSSPAVSASAALVPLGGDGGGDETHSSASKTGIGGAAAAAAAAGGGGGGVSLEPWERFQRSREAEGAILDVGVGGTGSSRVPFFDLSSTAEKGRFRVHDARGFDPSSMRRVAVKKEQGRPCGVALLLGRRPDDHKVAPGAEQVITVMFDRSFRVPSDDDDDEGGSGRYELPFASQAGAEAWWHRNKSWLLESNPVL